MQRIGALEAGGTKMVLGVFDEQGNELKRETFPTLSPEETVPRMLKFLSDNPVDALGIASFGPVDLHVGSKTYGSITTTPKTKWKHYNLLKALTGDTSIPCAFDTDVNAAALAEAELGAAKGMTDAVYITIGTGIGGGVLSGGKLVHGLLHPELGHMLLRPHPEDPNPRGVCPYHDGCLEGLAAGPAIGARINGDARTLPDDHPTFALEAYYLAQMCMNIIVTLSPQRIILGGGGDGTQITVPHDSQTDAGAVKRLCAVARHTGAYRRVYCPACAVPRQWTGRSIPAGEAGAIGPRVKNGEDG